jgi:hypothetical protein
MQNETKVNCNDIKARLRPFLDDVLTEDEHSAYCAHINTCEKCNNYVHSLGSFSNQVWKLGKVRVPQDLGSTIIYGLTHPGPQDQPPILTVSRRQMAAGAILVVLAAVTLFGASYFKNQRKSAGPEKNVIARLEPAAKPGSSTLPLSERQNQSVPDQAAPEEGASGEGPAATAAPVAQSAAQAPAGAVSSAAVLNNGVLHWHFKYSEPGRMDRLMNILNAMDIKPDYEGDNQLIFTASGEKAEHILEQLLDMVRTKSSFTDFTPDVATYYDKDYLISIYFEEGETNALHWHIDRLLPEKRPALLKVIKEFSSSVDYESDKMVVFSISDQQLENLKKRLQAMRVIVSEYGSVQPKEKILSSGPLTISVYFVK